MSSSDHRPPGAAVDGWRPVCRRCHRPEPVCLCKLLEGVPQVDNRTGITILQHPRERFHPLGTARLVQLGLRQVRLEVAFGARPGEGVAHRLELPPRSALLYPGPAAQLLDQIPPADRPEHLLLLDATWANARKLYRDNAWLEELPHVCLAPSSRGRYRIRREPDEQSLATVEAVFQALQILEPQTPGLEALMRAFNGMIDRQLELGRDRPGGPRRRLKRRPSRPVPAALLEHPERLVVVYGESAPAVGPTGQQQQRRLIQWTALQPESGACFERILRSEDPPPQARHLSHMGLTPELLEGGVEPSRLARDWRGFLQQTGGRVLAAWNASSLGLIEAQAHVDAVSGCLLKAAYCNLTHRPSGALEEVVAREGVAVAPARVQGRAAFRLGAASAMLTYLRASERLQRE